MSCDFKEFADATISNEFGGQPEPGIGALLAAGLEDSLGTTDGIADVAALLNRQSERLFAVNVFAGLRCGNRDFRMPVIGGADNDGVDPAVSEQIAEVFVLRAVRSKLLGRPVEVSLVYVAHSDDLHAGFAAQVHGVAKALPIAPGRATWANTGNLDRVVRSKFALTAGGKLRFGGIGLGYEPGWDSRGNGTLGKRL
jgi:hypothetical protein